MDFFYYNYETERNRLLWVDDAIATDDYSTDLTDQSSGNYVYDEMGNLISDAGEHITSISWNVQGKVSAVDKSTSPDLTFAYDAMGNRVMKLVKTSDHQETWTTTWYVRDAQGNVMATYNESYEELTSTTAIHHFAAAEYDIYGSSRLGLKDGSELFTRDITYVSHNEDGTFSEATYSEEYDMTDTEVGQYKRTITEKKYELSNHLGNVLVVITDRRESVDANTNTITDYFIPDVVSTTDYYAFGMEMPNRSFSSPDYRYGFNGKEKEGEWNGTGNTYDFGARIYDARVGRWLAVDAMANIFPEESPYVGFGDNPLYYTDPDGNYKLPKEIQEKYPNFYRYINTSIGNFMLSSPRIMQVLSKYSVGGLTPETIRDASTPGQGPNVVVRDFASVDKGQVGEGALGHYDYGTNTIQIDMKLVEHYEKILSNPNATEEAKFSIATELTSTFINEFTHYGDALDALDAIEDKKEKGNVVNGEQWEGEQVKDYDEGNEAAEELYPTTVIENTPEERMRAGRANYQLRKNGAVNNTNPRVQKDYVTTKDSLKEKDETLIPPIKF